LSPSLERAIEFVFSHLYSVSHLSVVVGEWVYERESCCFGICVRCVREIFTAPFALTCLHVSRAREQGYVKAHRGFYRDAIFVKRNNFNLLLHESRDVRRRLLAHPPFSSCAASRAKLRAAALTARPTRPSTRFLLCPTMAERISLSVVRGVNRAIRSHLATLSARLARAFARA